MTLRGSKGREGLKTKCSSEERMLDWLDELVNQDVGWLFHHLDLFKKVFDLIDENKNLKSKDPTVLNWMHRAFLNDLVIGIGRICDEDKRSRSLTRFLYQLKKEKHLLTRTHYVSLYKILPIEKAHKDFDGLAGRGKDTYHPSLIDEDIKKLTKEEPCKKILDFRNEYVAHINNRRNPPPPYGDLLASFKIIETVISKYYLLLRASSRLLTPVMQGDWQEVFTIPWINDGVLSKRG